MPTSGETEVFIDPADLAAELAAQGKDAFRRRYRGYFLRVVKFPDVDQDFLEPKTVETLSRSTLVNGGGEPANGNKPPRLGMLLRLQKSDRNVFKSRITVGRARNNDSVLRAPKISKLHAVFVKEGDEISGIMDMGSANGTFLNGDLLPKNQVVEIGSGDSVHFWRFEFEFLDLEALLQRVTGKD